MAHHSTRHALVAFFVRQILALCGFVIFILLALAVAAMATWNVADPSFSYATDNVPTNILGFPGAAFADLMMQFLGLASLLALMPLLAWALALIVGRPITRIPARLAAWAVGTFMGAATLGCFPAPLTWPIPNGIGGVIGDMILRFPALFVGTYPTGMVAIILGSIFILPTAGFLAFAAALSAMKNCSSRKKMKTTCRRSRAVACRQPRTSAMKMKAFASPILSPSVLLHICGTQRRRACAACSA